MPLLKDLNCSIELSGDQEPLQELGTVYGDAFVETFIPVPKKQQTFTIHLSSRNFIAPGIAMYVFIDGVYQCNRNRQDMKLRRPPDRRSLVDFKVRQKEERQKDGSMVAREWTFEKLDHASADDAPESCSPNILDNIGCIEVVVLRCAGTRNAKTAANMNLDGATDYPDYRFDSESRSRSVAYDDREPFKNTTHGRYSSLGSEPLFRLPYAESARDRKHSRDGRSLYSAPLSPGTRPHRDIPAPAFQYGSGPLPPLSRVNSQRGPMGGNISNISPRSVPAVDPGMLEKIVTDAVKRGVKEARKTDRSDAGHRSDTPRYHEGLENSSQVPGAWPASPSRPSRHPSYSASKRHSSRSRVGTRVAWDEEPEWDKDSKSNGWSSPEGKVDSWDTDETWSGKPLKGWDERRQRSKSASRTSQEPHRARGSSQARDRVSRKRRSRHRSSEKLHVRSRSHWTNDASSPSGDSVVSVSVEVPTDSCTSLERSDSTLKPSHSRSQTQPPKKKPARRSSGHKRSSVRSERRPSRMAENRQLYPFDVYQAQSPSVLVTNAPTMIPVPMVYNPADVQSQKVSVYSQAPNSIAAPPPTWGCASDKPRRKSAATTFLPPAPFSVIGSEGRKSRQASGSSSWGISGGKVAEIKAGDEAGLEGSSWGEGRQSHNDVKSVWGTDADIKTTDWEEDQTHGWGANNDKDKKNYEWSSDEKGSGGWDAPNAAKATTSGAWNETKKDDDWGERLNQDAVGDGWNIASNENGWEQNDTPNTEQKDPAGFQNDNPWGVAWETNTPWDQPQDTTKPNDSSAFNAEPSNIWRTIPTTNAPNPLPRSKHHTFNSLSKLHRLHPVASPPVTHRKFPPPLPKHTLRPTLSSRAISHTTRIPASPQHRIPLAAAAAKGVQHQVLAGPGTAYGHAVSRPEYVDSLEHPYAVFRFKYRSRSVLRGMFGGECLGVGGVQGKEELKGLGREELVRRLRELRVEMRRRGSAGESGSETGEKEKGEGEGSVKRGFTERWVDDQSRGRSVGKGGVKRGEKGTKVFDPEKVQW